MTESVDSREIPTKSREIFVVISAGGGGREVEKEAGQKRGTRGVKKIVSGNDPSLTLPSFSLSFSSFSFSPSLSFSLSLARAFSPVPPAGERSAGIKVRLIIQINIHRAGTSSASSADYRAGAILFRYRFAPSAVVPLASICMYMIYVYRYISDL